MLPMSIRQLTLREGASPRLVTLDPPTADALQALEIVQLVRTERADLWEVSAGTKIGVVEAPGLQIVVQPKVDINRLVFLMGYTRNPRFWRDDLVWLDRHADLPQALAEGFLAQSRQALEQGLLKGYVTVDESLNVLRGRIREGDQLRRHFGRTLPLETRYDDYSVDIAENRLLLAAAERLLRLPGLLLHQRTGLQRLRLQLADVARLSRGAELPTWVPSRLNARYHSALRLAELVLAGRSFEQRVGGVPVTGYLFNMATIFEDFVTVALKEALRAEGGRSRLQYRSYFDDREQVPIRPDFVWLDRDAPRIVADAKYKAEKPSGFPQADLYQMLAYCTVLGLDQGHIVYAKGNEQSSAYRVRNAGVEIVAHTLDLDLGPAELLSSIKRLSQLMQPVDPTPVERRSGWSTAGLAPPRDQCR